MLPGKAKLCAPPPGSHFPRRDEREVSFACAADAEFCRIISSYCARIAASEVRLAACGPFVGFAFFPTPARPWDLWMHFPATVSAFSPCGRLIRRAKVPFPSADRNDGVAHQCEVDALAATKGDRNS